MKLEVGRDVISDLWPLIRSGEASDGSRALVDAFLAGDRDFATQLKESTTMIPELPPVQLSPEAERVLLDDARDRARLKLLVIGGAVGLGGLLLLLALGGAIGAMFFLRG
jgi:hypothetical protein